MCFSQGGRSVGDRVPLFWQVSGDPPAHSPSACSLALSPPNVGSAHLTVSYLGAALWGGADWVHSVKQSNRAGLGGQETAPPHPRACGVGRMVPPPPVLALVRLWPYLWMTLLSIDWQSGCHWQL